MIITLPKVLGLYAGRPGAIGFREGCHCEAQSAEAISCQPDEAHLKFKMRLKIRIRPMR